jgi:hypothetical protein
MMVKLKPFNQSWLLIQILAEKILRNFPQTKT